MKSFLTRLVSGIVLLALIGVTCAFGSWPLWIFTLLIGFIGLHEFYKVFEISENSALCIAGCCNSALN